MTRKNTFKKRKKNLFIFFLLVIILISISFVFGFLVSKKLQTKQENNQLQQSEQTVQKINHYPPNYIKENLGISLYYPKDTYTVTNYRIDGYDEESKMNLKEAFIETHRHQPPNLYDAIKIQENKPYQGRYGEESPLTPFSLYVFHNPNNLSIQEWYQQYDYYPYRFGRKVKEVKEQEKPELFIPIGGKPGYGPTNTDTTPRGYVHLVYVSAPDKMCLLEFYGQNESDEGIKIANSLTFHTNIPDGWVTYTNSLYGFTISYPPSYQALTDSDHLSAFPHGIILFYTGGQIYDIIVGHWNYKNDYLAEYSLPDQQITVMERKNKFITLFNSSKKPENAKILSTLTLLN